MFAEPFIRHALLAGSCIALAAGLVGSFLLVRAQLFAADALGHVAFTGAIAAAVAGADLRLGLFGSTVLVAVVFALLGRRARADDAEIGVVFAWVLGIGVLLLDYYSSSSSGGNGILASRALFGSIFSLDRSDTLIAVLVGCAVALALIGIARPLLFGSLDPAAAAVRGVHVRVLGFAFLVLLALVAAEAAQALGALLLLGLLAAPAGAAWRLTAAPARALALAAALAVLSVWIGVALAYEIPSLPPSTAIVGVATAMYAAAPMIARWGS